MIHSYYTTLFLFIVYSYKQMFILIHYSFCFKIDNNTNIGTLYTLILSLLKINLKRSKVR